MNGYNSNRGYYGSGGNRFFNQIGNFFRARTTLSNLIAVNIAVWVLVLVVKVIGFLFQVSGPEMNYYITRSFGVPAEFSALLLHPWTFLTYMFLHIDFFHILFNMLWLFWFAQIFLRYMSAKQLLSTYLWGGFFGALLYIVAYNIFPAFSADLPYANAIGASAAVMAIMAATAVYAPHFRVNLLFVGPVKVWVIAAIYIGMDFLMIPNGNAGGHLAHIGGAIWGAFYAYNLRKGSDYLTLDLSRFRSWFVKSPKMKPKVNPNRRTNSDDEYNRNRQKNEQEIDTILEKISRHGYSSLTEEEKAFLFKNSKK